jgi:hypothetical protein
MPLTLQVTALGLRLAASSDVAKKAFSFLLRWSVEVVVPPAAIRTVSISLDQGGSSGLSRVA